ncbi:MAG: DUF2271 domain-containing protein [Pseudomarimonas sp.]
MNKLNTLLLLPWFACVTPADAAGIRVSVAIPPIDVAEYHRPYVAIWIEREDSSVAANLAVWYQQERGKPRPPKPSSDKSGAEKPHVEKRDAGKPNDAEGKASAGGNPDGGEGESGSKWLPDLRQWWRRSGRSASLPMDGVTGATRPVGSHELSFDATEAPLDSLAAGSYRLVVEAAREVGGRELLKIPFQWPPATPTNLSAEGKSELGRIALDLNP